MALKSFGDAVSSTAAASGGSTADSGTKATKTTKAAKPRKTATRRRRKAGDSTYLDEVGNSGEQ
jgi:hypothetical protein